MAAIHKLTATRKPSLKVLRAREKELVEKSKSLDGVFAAQKSAVLEFSERELKIRALGLLEEARREIYDRIAETKAETFTALQYNSAALQVEASIRDMVGNNARAYKAVAEPLAQHGIESLIEAVSAAEEKFSGAIVRLPIKEAMNFHLMEETKRSLLRQFNSSISSYGSGLIRDIEHDLSMAMLTNEPVQKTLKRLSARSPIFEGAQWKAERIWRTELANAYETTRQATAVWMKEEHFPDLKKKSIDPMDARTGQDSMNVAGQVKDINEPFNDGIREFMNHPNRPNDRGTQSLIREAWDKEE